MYPLIGVTSADDVSPKLYLEALNANEALGVGLPNCSGKPQIKGYLKLIDGLLLSGGPDINPLAYKKAPLKALGKIDPERDTFELEIARAALRLGIPVLGICRGIQTLNIAAGGEIYQDIYTETEKAIKHSQEGPHWMPSHKIKIERGTKLHRICRSVTASVNSLHHQAVKNPAPGFKVSARAEDGIIEAIEAEKGAFTMGVQWHPESMWKKFPAEKCLFRKFVSECSEKAGSRN